MSFRFHVQVTALTVALLSLDVILATEPSRAEEAAAPGEPLYRSRCAFCHEGGVARAPDLSALRQLAPERLSFALAFGMMNQQGRELSQAQIADIVGYLKGTAQAKPVLPDSNCHDAAPALNDATLPRWNGWGVG